MVAEWKKSLAVMWFVQVIGTIAITGMISFLPLYVSHLGISDPGEIGLWAGVLMGASSFAAAISNPYWGTVADRKGRKPMVEKTLLLFGLIIIAMAYVANVYQLLALRIFQGLCGGFVAASTALVTSMSPRDKIAFTVGLFQTAMIVGGAVGPMLGGVIADHFGYRQPFFVFGILCFVALGLSHLAVREKFTPVRRAKKESILKSFSYFWALPGLGAILFIQFLTQFATQSIGPILPIYIQSMVTGTELLASISGTMIAIGGVASALASLSMGFISRHVSHGRILLVAALGGAITFVGQLLAQDIITFGLLRALNGLFIGAMIPSSNTLLTLLIPEEKRGVAFGITSSAALLGNMLGPLSAGVLSLHFSLSSIFWVTSVLFVTAFVLMLCYDKQGSSHEIRE
ncbi:MAG: MFS transporter [Sporomusaceae bacterium]|nr:MFS transporter [Sporomusaceae bacterium]